MPFLPPNQQHQSTTGIVINVCRLRNDQYCVEWGVKLYSNSINVWKYHGNVLAHNKWKLMQRLTNLLSWNNTGLRVVPDKRPLNGSCCCCCAYDTTIYGHYTRDGTMFAATCFDSAFKEKQDTRNLITAFTHTVPVIYINVNVLLKTCCTCHEQTINKQTTSVSESLDIGMFIFQ